MNCRGTVAVGTLPTYGEKVNFFSLAATPDDAGDDDDDDDGARGCTKRDCSFLESKLVPLPCTVSLEIPFRYALNCEVEYQLLPIWVPFPTGRERGELSSINKYKR